MDARQLEYFLAVVDHGGVNRAAQALFVAQPSLSQAIRTLERDLGVDLFHRVGRRVVLTQAGTALIEPAREVVRGLATARTSVESAAGLQTGRVDVAATPSQTVEPLTSMIRRFTRRHPGLSVAIRDAATAAGVVHMVRTGVVEVGVVASSDPVAAAGVHVHDLGVQRFVLVTAADGPFPSGRPVPRECLSGQRLIVGPHGSGMRALVEEIRAGGVALTEVVETEHREAILPLVLAGVGIAVLAESWTALAERAGARVLALEPSAHLHLALVTRAAGLSPAAAAFRDAAT